MTTHRLCEDRPRPYPQLSTVCVPGHGTASAADTPLVIAMTRAVLEEHT